MIVMDASALFEIAEQTPMGDAYSSMILEDERVISVDYLQMEMASIVRKSVLRGEMPAQDAAKRLQASLDLVDELVPAENLLVESLNESIRLQHSVYDMAYFVLARRKGATLLTADKRLADLCLDHGVNCVAEVAI